MKQMTLIEMDGFLKGECIPRDLKVNETNAEYLVRKFGELESKLETALRECRSAGITIDNLEAKCAALAAENATFKDINAWCKTDAFSNMYREFKTAEAVGCCNIDCMHDAMLVAIMHAPETPATDAFLAEVRAKAFDDLCAAFVKHASVSGLDDGDCVTVKEATDALLHCAEQLHEGVHS
ncbi:hypothetical protein ABLL99_002738 [Escherichia coli]